MADDARIEPVEFAERWRTSDRTSYGTCFEHFHRLSMEMLDVRTEIGEIFQRAFFEVCDPERIPFYSLQGVTLPQAMARVLGKQAVDGLAWTDLDEAQKVRACHQLGLNPAGVLFHESPTDAKTVALGNFWSRRSSRFFLRHLIAVTENQIKIGEPIEVAGKFCGIKDQIEATAVALEIANDAIACLQADGGFPYSVKSGQFLSTSMTAILYPFADMESCVVPYFQAYFDWMEEVQRLNLWLIYKDRSLKPRPVLTTPQQNVVDQLARAGGNLTTTKLKTLFTNLYRDKTIDQLEDNDLVVRKDRKGVWLTDLGWRCTEITAQG